MIAIIDADLVGKNGKRFPNLACMKISAFEKNRGKQVSLKMDYENLDEFEKVYISKVFTSTPIPKNILELHHVVYGGTGFYFDKSPPLPYEIEHIMPDYSIYDKYTELMSTAGRKKTYTKGFTDYSIGFLTRGCFRQCDFCINRSTSICIKNAPLNEFFDCTREKLMFLDDNFLACNQWRAILEDVIELNRKITFKQGLDLRLISSDFMNYLARIRYDGEIFVAFDSITDANLIEHKLELFRSYSNKPLRMYTLCGFDINNRYDKEFWAYDIESIFLRLEIMKKYNVLPYITRFERYKGSPYEGLYNAVSAYCNQPALFKKMCFFNFCIMDNNQRKSNKVSARLRSCLEFLNDHPRFTKYFNTTYWT